MKTVAVALTLTLGFASSIPAQQDNTIYKPGEGASAPKLVKNVSPQ